MCELWYVPLALRVKAKLLYQIGIKCIKIRIALVVRKATG